eukprot:82365-Hanusia_phi.AAC.2
MDDSSDSPPLIDKDDSSDFSANERTSEQLLVERQDLGWMSQISASRQRSLKALAFSIAYIKKLQKKYEGSIDGIELPCISHLRKKQNNPANAHGRYHEIQEENGHSDQG